MKESYKIQTEIKINAICVPNIKICQYDHIYLNIELFGETQRSKLFHPNFPIEIDEKFYFEKVFWSPSNKDEVMRLLEDSPVSIELRHLPGCSKESKLLAFSDLNARDVLVCESHLNEPLLEIEKAFNLKSTENHYGPAPRVKLYSKSRILRTRTPAMDDLMVNADTGSFCCIHDSFRLKRQQMLTGGTHVTDSGQMYSCNCSLHTSSEASKHCVKCHQDYTSNTHPLNSFSDLVALRGSADDSRLFYGNSDVNGYDDRWGELEDASNTQFRPPFVVRKVPEDLVGRVPDAYDSVYNTAVRENTRLRSNQQKKLRRLRSVSPAKRNVSFIDSKARQASKFPATGNQVSECYACRLPPDDVRISCDACNLTHRGEMSSRGWDLARPEPPSLRTYRETADQRPVFNTKTHSCRLCNRERMNNSLSYKTTTSIDPVLMRSKQPLYQIEGYRNMAKYLT